ncbi:MAG: DUF1598 domain-containing protein [Pirellulaceae bacterium]
MRSRILMFTKRCLQAAACVMFATLPCYAGVLAARGSAVGGVSINVEGVLTPAPAEARKRLLEEMRKAVTAPAGEISKPVELRMISLKMLEAACADALKNNFGRLPDEVRFLAGIQRLQYVFVYPEANDIVLAGPGEGWRVDDGGNVVGVTTGRPVLQLDDLLVAFRSVEAARQGGISVSIDPTEEGTRRLMDLLSNQRRVNAMTPQLEAAMKEAFGPQQVTVTGVPATSHFARVLVAADYRMKRIAMKLEPSPVRELKSYLDLISGQRASAVNNASPRWWLACNYQPLATTDDGLAWELRGPGVKAMTEDEVISATGERKETGRTSRQAQRWADMMTEQYDALSSQEPIFGELRNLMDMCVVAALVRKEHLVERAGLSLPLLMDEQSELKSEVWNAPKVIAPEVSFLQGRGSFIVTASGGVAVESWFVADQKEIVAQVAQIRQRATPGKQAQFWW